jgi:hypothetical protein
MYNGTLKTSPPEHPDNSMLAYDSSTKAGNLFASYSLLSLEAALQEHVMTGPVDVSLSLGKKRRRDPTMIR